MVTIGEALRYYKQKGIQEALVEQAKDKEVVGSYSGQGYGKRPDILQYPADVLALVKQGVTSFHASEELWKNPLQLVTTMAKQEQHNLRKGWDLLLDIDCQQWRYSQVTAHYLVEALNYAGIKNVFVKFSGNHGFHIAVPYEAFPTEVHGKLVKNLFPQAPRIIAQYLQDVIKSHIAKTLLAMHDIQTIADSIQKTVSDIQTRGVFDPFKVLDIDTILISSRHLYRMAYSFNEKSGLISVPVDSAKIREFTLEHAKAENAYVRPFPFLSRTSILPDEARQLFIQAYDHKPTTDAQTTKRQEYYSQFEEIEEAIPEQMFPMCMQNILKGLTDGRKRGLFLLVNFLRSAGWSKEQIEQRIYEWNTRNSEPLREVYLKGQLRFDKETILPPNCHNDMYYKEIGVKCDDSFCRRVKNPVVAAKRALLSLRPPKGKREKLTDEQREMRRKYRKGQEKTQTNTPPHE